MTIPHLVVEMHLRDVATADIERLLRMLKEMGGVYVVVEHPETPAVPMPPDVDDPAPLPPPVPLPKTLPLRADAGKTCQDAINLFDRAFGRGVSPDSSSPWYIRKIIESGLSALGVFTVRGASYLSPPFLFIEDMPLSDADRQKLMDALE